MRMLYTLLMAMTIFGQQTPQLEIIPYNDGTPGTLRFYENRSTARNFAAFRGSDSISTDCTYRISDVSFLPCASDQVVLGSTGLRYSGLYGRLIDLTSSSTPTLAQLYVRRFSNAGLISAVDNGSGEMEFTVTNGGVEKFFVGESAIRLGVTADTFAVRPATTSTYSLGSHTRRWTNFFTDNATITTGFRLTTTSTTGDCLVAFDTSGNGAWAACPSGGSPGGSGTEIQYRSGASTFGAVTGSSVSGADMTIAGIITGNHVRTNTNDTYSIGTSSTRFNVGYFNALDLRTGASTAALYIRTAALAAKVIAQETSGNGDVEVLDSSAITLFRAQNSGITMNRTATTNAITPATSYSYNNGGSSNYWNGYWGRFINLQSQNSSSSPATINIRNDAAGLLFTMGDTGTGAGDFRVYDSGVAKLEVYSGQTNITTTNIQMTGTTTHTGTIQFSADNTYNIGSSSNKANDVYMNRSRATAYYYNGTIGVTGTITGGTCVMTFTAGGLTSTSGTC